MLRLPYELRLDIYELVLGKRQIHISFKPWEQPGSNKCRRKSQRVKQNASKPELETIKGHFTYTVLPERRDPWQWDVAAGDSAKDAVDKITLLSGVCRQLYHETVVLPQKLNTWSFQSTHLMERFFLKDNAMPLHQRRAIQTLYCKDRLAKEVKAKLRGLKIIVWKDHKGRLRWQDLRDFPEIAWKDRKELKRRTQRWDEAAPLHNMGHKSTKSSANTQRHGDETNLSTPTTGLCSELVEEDPSTDRETAGSAHMPGQDVILSALVTGA